MEPLLLLCLKVFFVRILDVSLGTFRTVITVKGQKLYASIVGFFEIFVWFVIVREALNTDIDSIFIAISYALGFSVGTYIGGVISEKFIKGNILVQVVTNKNNQKIIKALKDQGFGVSITKVYNDKLEDDKFMLFVSIDKDKFKKVKSIIEEYDQNAFIIANESKSVYNGYFSK